MTKPEGQNPKSDGASLPTRREQFQNPLRQGGDAGPVSRGQQLFRGEPTAADAADVFGGEPGGAVGAVDAAEWHVFEAEMLIGGGDGFEVFEAAAEFGRKEFEEL